MSASVLDPDATLAAPGPPGRLPGLSSHPESIGAYKVEGLIGEGSMGCVYRGWDESLGRAVAIKLIAPHVAGDPGALRRFEREARLAASVKHANAVHIYGMGQHAGLPYLVMECIEGTSLADRR